MTSKKTAAFLMFSVGSGIIVLALVGAKNQAQTLVNAGQPTRPATNPVYMQVADNAERQYRMGYESATTVDRCVHAGLVAEAYLQADDLEDYTRWKQTQKTDCWLANVPTE